MTTDRYAKTILTVIAIALSMIALNPWIAPTPAKAGTDDPALYSLVGGIGRDVHGIYNAICSNRSYECSVLR